MEKKKIAVGYQGMENSNNHRAAAAMADRLPHDDAEIELVPLISSANVVKALLDKSIEYGVMAVSGTDGWMVPETVEAREGVDLKQVDKICIEIHHYLFKKDATVPTDSIKKIASHPAALLVCHNHVRALYPNIQECPVEDTALSAKELSEGVLSADTAVLCSQKAGEQYGLCLIQGNMQDRDPNGVNFEMFALNA